MNSGGGFHPQTDPGWAPVLRRYFVSAITLGLYGRKSFNLDGLGVARLLFLTLLQSGLLFVFVGTFIWPMGDPDPVQIAVVAAVGLAGLSGAVWSRSRPLDASSTEAYLAGTYRTIFFLGFLCAEVPLLISLALAFLWDGYWPLLVALPFFLVGMVLIAPGRANLARRQQQIQLSGSTMSLIGALNKPVESPDEPE